MLFGHYDHFGQSNGKCNEVFHPFWGCRGWVRLVEQVLDANSQSECIAPSFRVAVVGDSPDNVENGIYNQDFRL